MRFTQPVSQQLDNYDDRLGILAEQAMDSRFQSLQMVMLRPPKRSSEPDGEEAEAEEL